MKRLFSNIGWLLGGRGFNAVMSLVYLYLATHTLGLEGFGHFALIVALGQAITGFAKFQTWLFIVRWGANGSGSPESPDPKSVCEATGFAMALDMLSVVMGTAAAAILIMTASVWLALPQELYQLTFAYCVISLLSIRTTPTGLLRLRFKYRHNGSAQLLLYFRWQEPHNRARNPQGKPNRNPQPQEKERKQRQQLPVASRWRVFTVGRATRRKFNRHQSFFTGRKG